MPIKCAKEVVLVFAFFACKYSYAQDSKLFYLKKNESISEILYDRLKITPIYGQKNALNHVLIFNKLNLDKSKKLKEGHPISIPIFLLPSVLAGDQINAKGDDKELTQSAALENKPIKAMISKISPTETPIIKNHFIAFNSGMFSYNGKNNQGGTFSISAPFVNMTFRQNRASDKLITVLDGSLQLTCVTCSTQKKIRPSFFIKGSKRRTFFDTFLIGVGLGFDNDIYIQEKLGKADVFNAVVSNAFLTLENDHNHYSFLVKIGTSIPLKIDNKNKINTTFGSLEILKKMHSWSFGFAISQDYREVEDYKQTLSKFSILTKWNLN